MRDHLRERRSRLSTNNQREHSYPERSKAEGTQIHRAELSTTQKNEQQKRNACIKCTKKKLVRRAANYVLAGQVAAPSVIPQRFLCRPLQVVLFPLNCPLSRRTWKSTHSVTACSSTTSSTTRRLPWPATHPPLTHPCPPSGRQADFLNRL
jgi:hypothetical protein